MPNEVKLKCLEKSAKGTQMVVFNWVRGGLIVLSIPLDRC